MLTSKINKQGALKTDFFCSSFPGTESDMAYVTHQNRGVT